MLQKNQLQLYSRVIQIGYKLKYVHYTWNPTCNQFEQNASKARKCACFVWLSILLALEAFTLYGTIRLCMDPKVPAATKFKSQYLTYIYIGFNMHHWVTWTHYSCQHSLINCFIQPRTKFEGTVRGPGMKSKLFPRYIRAVLILAAFSCLTNSLTILRKPDSPLYITSLVPSPASLPFPLKLAACAVYTLVNSFHYFHFWFQCSTNTLSLTGLSWEVDNFRSLESSGRLTPTELAVKYTYIRLLADRFNIVFSTWNFTFLALGCSIVILNFVQAILLLSGRGFVVTLLAGTCLLWSQKQNGRLFYSSEEILWQARTSSAKGWQKAYWNASRPLRVSYEFFFADKSFVLTVLAFIVENAVSLLLGLRDGSQFD